MYFLPLYIFSVTVAISVAARVASLEQLSLAEFNGEEARPKVYKKGHKNVLGIWFNSETKVKI